MLYAFVKIGQHEHMERLLLDGQLYFNTFKFFQRLEGEAARGDRDEGLARVFQSSNLSSFAMESPTHGKIELGPHLVGQVKVAFNVAAEHNMFCLYAMRDLSASIDARCAPFGDTAVVIKDPPSFLERLKTKLLELGHQGYEHTFVEYVERESYDGPMGFFRKYAEYSYQSEFRIVLEPTTGEPVTIEIGSIEDIAELHPLSRFL